MLGYRRLADLTADSMVQCLMVPTETFMILVKTEAGVYTRAWQATAAQLAAQHHHILGEHVQLAPLNMFFRSGRAARLFLRCQAGFHGLSTTQRTPRELFVMNLHDASQHAQMRLLF
jgi:hypothetical protein